MVLTGNQSEEDKLPEAMVWSYQDKLARPSVKL